VEDVATVEEVDEASMSWNRLEYARFQVRMLKSRKAELSKGLWINGTLFNITLVEELNRFDGDNCRCKCVHNYECSSDNVSSFESFVEDSVLSENLNNEGGENRDDSRWWPEVGKGEGWGCSTEKTKKGLEKESAEDFVTCQKKSASSCTKTALSTMGVSEERTAMSASQQVNVACGAIQNSLVNLVEEVESYNSLNNRPILSEAQCRESGSKAHSENRVVTAPNSETPMGGTCDPVAAVGLSSTSESEKEVQPQLESMMEGNKGASGSLLWVQNSLSEQINGRTNIAMEGCGGDSGKKTINSGSGSEETLAVDNYQTPERVRHLRALW